MKNLNTIKYVGKILNINMMAGSNIFGVIDFIEHGKTQGITVSSRSTTNNEVIISNTWELKPGYVFTKEYSFNGSLWNRKATYDFEPFILWFQQHPLECSTKIKQALVRDALE